MNVNQHIEAQERQQKLSEIQTTLSTILKQYLENPQKDITKYLESIPRVKERHAEAIGDILQGVPDYIIDDEDEIKGVKISAIREKLMNATQNQEDELSSQGYYQSTISEIRSIMLLLRASGVTTEELTQRVADGIYFGTAMAIYNSKDAQTDQIIRNLVTRIRDHYLTIGKDENIRVETTTTTAMQEISQKGAIVQDSIKEEMGNIIRLDERRKEREPLATPESAELKEFISQNPDTAMSLLENVMYPEQTHIN